MPQPRAYFGAAARAFVPFGGSVLSTHLANFAARNAVLPALPNFQNDDRILVVAPHPDDETLCCGGVLKRAAHSNIAAKTLFLTNGDGSRTAQIFKTLREPLARDNDLFSLAQQRQIEALNALKKLGQSENSADFLGFPDGGLTSILNSENIYWSPLTKRNHVAYPRAYAPGARYHRQTLLDLMARVFDEFQPTIIFTSHPLDTHLDHAATFHLCVETLKRAALKTPPRLETFLVHYGIWPVPNGLHLDETLAPPAALLQRRGWRSLALNQNEIEAKLSALESYPSQLVSLPRYLRAFVRRNELFDSHLP